MKLELYPAEICLWDEVVESSPITFLMNSPLFVNAVLFMIEAVSDCRSNKPCGLKAQHHLLETLRLLQETLASESGQNISDHTIMTVNMLAMTAERLNDSDSMANHVKGLKQMVNLRGGFHQWKPYIYDLQSKVCRFVLFRLLKKVNSLTLARADLGLAIRFGHRPLFFNDEISWTSYLHATERVQTVHSPLENAISTLIRFLDWRLVNVLTDLRQFSHLCNLGHQTGYKLRRHTFGEIMVSVLYRLLYLSFKGSPLDEAIRLGMVIFGSSIILQGQKCGHAILDGFISSLLELHDHAATIDVPPSIIFWLLIVWKIHVSEEIPQSQLEVWSEEAIKLAEVYNWEDARAILKAVMWIDILHDSKGERYIRNLKAKSVCTTDLFSKG